MLKKRDNIITLLLSFVAGFVDTSGFIKLSGLFTAHITGNLVLAGSSFTLSNNTDALKRLLLIPVFIIAVIITAIIIKRYSKTGFNVLKLILVIQAIFLFLFSLSELFFLNNRLNFLQDNAYFFSGLFGVVAMATQNTYMKLLLPNLAATTVMTGNVTLLSIQLSNNKTNLVSLSVICSIMGFIIGAGFGALLVYEVGLFSNVLPAAIILTLAFFLKHHSISN